MIKKHLELKTYTSYGVDVLVKINFDKGQISLCETIPHQTIQGETTFQDKKWIFAKRGIECMQGWKSVLHAMENAIDTATNEIVEYKKQLEAYKAGEICEMMDIASEIIKGRQGKIKKGKK